MNVGGHYPPTPYRLSAFHPLPNEGEGWGEGDHQSFTLIVVAIVGLRVECGGFPPPAPPCHLLFAQKVAENAPSQRRYSLGGGKRGVFHEAGKPRGVKPFAPSDGALRGERRRALTFARDVS